MVREGARGTKLEALYKMRKGVLLENSNHTITFLPAGRTQHTIISKRDIGQKASENKPCCSIWSNTQINQQHRISEKKNKVANENETPNPLFDARESDVTGQSVTANDVNSEINNNSTKQSQSSEQGPYQPIVTPNCTIGTGKPKRTSHQ